MLPCPAMSCHVVPCHLAPCLIVQCRTVSCLAVSYHAMSYRVVPCRALPYLIMLCLTVSCHVVPSKPHRHWISCRSLLHSVCCLWDGPLHQSWTPKRTDCAGKRFCCSNSELLWHERSSSHTSRHQRLVKM